MPFTVLRCNRCQSGLQIVPAHVLDVVCAHCGLTAPVEAFRWMGLGLDEASARDLADTWNGRLARGLRGPEVAEFAGLAP